MDYRRAGWRRTTGGRQGVPNHGIAGSRRPVDAGGLVQDPGIAGSPRAFIGHLISILDGTRERSLADDPELLYADAAELRLLMEAMWDSRAREAG